MVLGIVAGVVVIESVFFIERKLKIDDPVGAISVHGVCGTLGALSVGLVANGKYGQGWNLTTNNLDAEGNPQGIYGLFYGHSGAGQFMSQLVGVVIIWTVIFGIAFAFFKIQNALTKGGIRSDEDEEIAGLDLPEMGVLAYPDFVGTHEGTVG
jgi:Amt family ammonium transporter